MEWRYGRHTTLRMHLWPATKRATKWPSFVWGHTQLYLHQLGAYNAVCIRRTSYQKGNRTFLERQKRFWTFSLFYSAAAEPQRCQVTPYVVKVLGEQTDSFFLVLRPEFGHYSYVLYQIFLQPTTSSFRTQAPLPLVLVGYLVLVFLLIIPFGLICRLSMKAWL